MVDRIRYPTVSYLPFYYVFFQFLLLTIFNLQANILTTKDILSNLGRDQPSKPCRNESIDLSAQCGRPHATQWKKKIESFWPKKVESLAELWRIFESNWLSISSQFDSQYRVNLTLNIESIWLSISSQFDSQYRVNLTLNIESIWLSISSQFDSQYRVNLTQIFSNFSESRSNFSSVSDSTF